MLTRFPYFIYTEWMPTLIMSPFEMYDEGAELIQDIKTKLGDKLKETLGEELAQRMEEFLYDHEHYWDEDDFEEEDEEEGSTEDVLPDASEGETD